MLNEPLPWTMIPEELGEMTGSLLFAFSLLVALRPLVADSLPGRTSAPPCAPRRRASCSPRSERRRGASRLRRCHHTRAA